MSIIKPKCVPKEQMINFDNVGILVKEEKLLFIMGALNVVTDLSLNESLSQNPMFEQEIAKILLKINEALDVG